MLEVQELLNQREFLLFSARPLRLLQGLSERVSSRPPYLSSISYHGIVKQAASIVSLEG